MLAQVQHTTIGNITQNHWGSASQASLSILKYGFLEDRKDLLTLYQGSFISLWFCNFLKSRANLSETFFILPEGHKEDNVQAGEKQTNRKVFFYTMDILKPPNTFPSFSNYPGPTFV